MLLVRMAVSFQSVHQSIQRRLIVRAGSNAFTEEMELRPFKRQAVNRVVIHIDLIAPIRHVCIPGNIAADTIRIRNAAR